MTQTFEAIFDGEVLRPTAPLCLLPNTKVTVTLEVPSEAGPRRSFLETVMALKLEGPSDWSENLDRYLHEDRISTHE
jgi:hypothetical protein